jgi:hypothetical protein
VSPRSSRPRAICLLGSPQLTAAPSWQVELVFRPDRAASVSPRLPDGPKGARHYTHLSARRVQIDRNRPKRGPGASISSLSTRESRLPQTRRATTRNGRRSTARRSCASPPPGYSPPATFGPQSGRRARRRDRRPPEGVRAAHGRMLRPRATRGRLIQRARGPPRRRASARGRRRDPARTRGRRLR